MTKREFLMLAENWEGQDPNGWFCSIKLDGSRAWWDGGVSRGRPASEVPWANTAKDGRLTVAPIATGLWSRYGKVVRAPGWWLDLLPRVPVDMELWMGRGTFQLLRSTVGAFDGTDWRPVKAMALDVPSYSQVFADGDINNANWRGSIRSAECMRFAGAVDGQPRTFEEAVQVMRTLPQNDNFRVHEQVRVSSVRQVEEMAAAETRLGGEGLVLRHPSRAWYPKRVGWCLKVKPVHDMEGTVEGFTWGRKTDRGSRNFGRLGALILRLESGVRLELSGFTDAERAVRGPQDDEWVALEGKDASVRWESVHFPRGCRVTFTYRELSNDGVPKEARYLRRRDE